MKNYTITVNGNVYDVTVEEGGAGSTPVAAPKAAPKVAPKAAAAPKAAPAGAGAVKITAPMPGKIVAVKKGQVILVLEAMKMENDVVAPQDGTLASVDVATGASVEAGSVLATMN